MRDSNHGIEAKRYRLGVALRLGVSLLLANLFVGESPAHDWVSNDHGPFAKAVAEYVVVQNLEPKSNADGSVDVVVELPGSTLELSLWPHSLRAPDFELRNTDELGDVWTVDPLPSPATYRGSVPEASGSLVAASIRNGRVSAFVSLGRGNDWRIEPLDHFEPGADPSRHIAWPAHVPSFIAESGSNFVALSGTGLCEDVLSLTEIAFDSDDNFCRVYSNNANDAAAAIEQEMNSADAIFRRDASIGWEISHIETRCTTGELDQSPYTTSVDTELLCQLHTHWGFNFSGVHRDIAHLKTGKSLAGGFGGVSEPDSICGRAPRGNCIVNTEVMCTTDADCEDRERCGPFPGKTYGKCGPQLQDDCCIMDGFYTCFTDSDCPTNAGCQGYDDCNEPSLDAGYSLSIGSSVGAMAHELGHNYGASHCDPAVHNDCDIMLESAGSTSFSQVAIGEMHDFRATLSCIDYREYVDHSASGNNDGTSWADAHTDLQDALVDTDTCSEAVEVWVAAGNYLPDPSSRSVSFQLRNGVSIFGGFVGGETGRDERDPETNRTALSGDLNTNDTASFNNNSDNSYHVVDGSGTDATALLDGFVVTAGNADGIGANENRGGGILNDAGSPTIAECTVAYNHADGLGGGMANLNGSNPTIRNSVFVHNKAGVGGAMSNSGNSSPQVTRTQFVRNEAQSGGGVTNQSSSPEFVNVVFAGNEATSSSLDGGGAVVNVFGSDARFVNGAFVGNSAADRGGAILNSASNAQVLHTTIADNHSSGLEAGGIKNESSGNPIVRNGIVWGNTSVNGGEAAQIASDSGTPAIDYMCVQGWTGGLGGGGNTGSDPKFIGASVGQWTGTPTYDATTFRATFTDAGRSWSDDVLVGKFLNPNTAGQELYSQVVANTATTITVLGVFGVNGFPGDPYRLVDYHLRSGSSAENAGSNILVTMDRLDIDGDGNTSESLPFDLDEEIRVQSGTIDMGAYEGAYSAQLVNDVDFSGGGADWAPTTQSGGGSPPPTITTDDISPMDDALHIFRPPFPDDSSAWVSQAIGVPVAPVEELTLSFDVWVSDQNFDQYDTNNVYPANVWLFYEDEFGGPQSFRRSFYLSVAPGHTPDPEPLAEMLPAAIWSHREFDLGNLLPPIAQLVEIRIASEGWSYDVAFDNVSLILEVPGPDCNANGTADSIEVDQGLAPDCNANGIPDACDLAAQTSNDCDNNSIPDECDPDTDSDGVPDACDDCAYIVDPGQEDCDTDGIGDVCVIASGADPDVNGNGLPDSCDPLSIPASSRVSRLFALLALIGVGIAAMRRARRGPANR